MEEAGKKFKQILPQVHPDKKPAFVRINYKDSWKINCFFNYDADKQRSKKEVNTHRVLVNKENCELKGGEEKDKEKEGKEKEGSKSQRLQRRPRR